MTEEDAVALYKRAKRIAEKIGFGDLSEDVAQEVVCKRLAGMGAHQFVKHSVMDAAQLHYRIPSEPLTDRNERGRWDFNDGGFYALCFRLSPFEKDIAHKYFVEGYTGVEIAREIGRSGGMVSRILNGIVNKLREEMRDGNEIR